MVDAVELVKRLREICIDWTGEPIVDGSTPRVEPEYGLLRKAATAIEALVAERDEARRLAQTLLQAGQEDLALMTETAATLTSLRSRAEAAESKLDRAKEALRPFKVLADCTDSDPAGAAVIVNVNHARRARSTLDEIDKP